MDTSAQVDNQACAGGFMQAMHPEDRDRYVAEYQRAINNAQAYTITYRVLDADGNYQTFSEQGTPKIAPDGTQSWEISCTPEQNGSLKALQESEQRYRSLAIATSQIVWTTDAEGKVDDMPLWREYTGQTLAEVKGWSWMTSIHPEDRDRTALAWNHAVRTKTLYDTEYRIRAADGSYRYFWARGVPVIAADNTIREWVGISIDIHERKRTEAQLRNSEQRYRELANAMPLIVWTAQTNGDINYYNQRWYDYTGLTPERSIGFGGWQTVIHPEDLPTCLQRWQQAVTNGELYEIEYRLHRQDGTYRWHLGRALPVTNAQGKIVYWVGTATDIDDHKHVEAALKESEHRFRSMADNAPVMIWVAAQNGLCTWFNQPWLDFTGRSLAQEMGDGWMQAIHPEDLQRYLDTYASAQHTRETFQIEYRLRRSDGEYRWVYNTGVPRSTSNAGYIGSCIDITERIAIEAALKHRAQELTYLTKVLAQTNAALEKRNQELDQFAYVASHDLKAPLRAIANLSQWIEEDISDQLDAENRRQMELLRGRVHRLEALIDGLLQYSRVGRQATALESVDVSELLTEVVNLLTPPPEFTVNISPGMPTFVTHRLLLFQVFSNLISNAIKHHNRADGQVTISVTEQGKFYEFAVTDDGPGIAPAYHTKIFGIFQTLEARDKVENTGVGLAIVKKIVETQGGTICVESQENLGSTFRFTWHKQAN